MKTQWRIICPACKCGVNTATDTENLSDEDTEYVEAFYCVECGAELVMTYSVEQTVNVYAIDHATKQEAVRR